MGMAINDQSRLQEYNNRQSLKLTMEELKEQEEDDAFDRKSQ
jgi:hypothetical protein